MIYYQHIKKRIIRDRLIILTIIVFCGLFLFFNTRSLADENHGSQMPDTDTTDAKILSKNPDYIIGPEDEIEIFVWRNPDFSRTVIVGPDGKISLPLLDDMNAAGLTLKELGGIIAEKYSVFIKDPHVSVFIKGLKSKRITVLGEVVQPGVYPIAGRLNVLEAIALAGGYTKDANLNRVKVMRAKKGENATIFVNVKDIMEKDQKKEDIILQADDIVFVPESFF